MGLIRRAAEQRSSLTDPAQWLSKAFGAGHSTYVGKNVSPETAMECVAVYACVRVLSETIASLPLNLYRRLPSGGKEKATNHPLQQLLHDEPNPEMTRVEMWEALIGHLATRGNAYCQKRFDGAGRVRELWPLRPDRMRVERNQAQQIIYHYNRVNGPAKDFLPDEILHLRGLSGDGLVGFAPLTLARQAVGLALATEEYGARFFGSGSQPSGVLRTDTKLSKDVADRVKDSWQATHGGLDNAHHVAVLEQGLEWQTIGIPPEDAQFLETRKFQTTEIARIFRIPPHMIADLDRATFSNIEHQDIEFVKHTIRPWLVRIEQRLNHDLLSEKERQTHFVEHLVDGLLRGDSQARAEMYQSGFMTGYLSINDIREMENRNPIDGGDEHFVPLNMIPLSVAEDVQQSDSVESGDRAGQASVETRISAGENAVEERRRIACSFQPLIKQSVGRVVRREEADIMRQAEKTLMRGDVAEFIEWLSKFYLDHREFYVRNMHPIFIAIAEQVCVQAASQIGFADDISVSIERFIDSYADAASLNYVGSNEGQLVSIVRETPEVEVLQARFDEWRERTPGKQAMIHTVRAVNAVTHETWRLGGIRQVQWATHGDSCPYCNALANQKVSISDSFLRKGLAWQPSGADVALTPARNISHPPAHDGCDCGLIPVI